ncbi:zinc finger (CCCH type) motif-containing protein [Toxoplasma gondii MAS]|uniref:Zinc finger (CCCH type) motif-containing protein n=2 Tax=Toxoplasma gondii TaxID=5811 RepID=A0A086QQT4_TOXGO|nr:zinc finger (CCCH type) motif-containing protein [Toxoplasma gondii MAS]PUA89062.1 zinc finger (CCCH type) motif-containing protein [Toxoplasma gondii TgCATBr9]
MARKGRRRKRSRVERKDRGFMASCSEPLDQCGWGTVGGVVERSGSASSTQELGEEALEAAGRLTGAVSTIATRVHSMEQACDRVSGSQEDSRRRGRRRRVKHGEKTSAAKSVSIPDGEDLELTQANFSDSGQRKEAGGLGQCREALSKGTSETFPPAKGAQEQSLSGRITPPPATPDNVLVPASLGGTPISTFFFKTKMCRFLRQGRCKHGASCQFAHSPEELRTPPNLTKTRLCRAFREGRCDRGENCAFAHGLVDLRGTGEIYKTQICIFWPAGHGNRVSDGCRHAVGVADLASWGGERVVADNDTCGPSLTSTRPSASASASQQSCGRGGDEQRSSPAVVCRSPLHTAGSPTCQLFGSLATMDINGCPKGTCSGPTPYGSPPSPAPASPSACSSFAASVMSFSQPIYAPPAPFPLSRPAPRTTGACMREQAIPVTCSHICRTSEFSTHDCATPTSSQPSPTEDGGGHDSHDIPRRMKPLFGVMEQNEDIAVKRPSEICSRPRFSSFPEGHLSSEKTRVSLKIAKSMKAQFRSYVCDVSPSVLSPSSSCSAGIPEMDFPASVGAKKSFGICRSAPEGTQSPQSGRLPSSVHTLRESRSRGADTSEHSGGCEDISDHSGVVAVTSAARGERAGVECHASRHNTQGRPVIEAARSMLVVSFLGSGRSGRSRDTTGTWKRAPPIPPPPPLSFSSLPSHPFRCGDGRGLPEERTSRQTSGCIDSSTAFKPATCSVPLLVSPWGDASDRNADARNVNAPVPTAEVEIRRSQGSSPPRIRQHWHSVDEQPPREAMQPKGGPLTTPKQPHPVSSSGAYLLPGRLTAALTNAQTRGRPGCAIRGTVFCRTQTLDDKGGVSPAMTPAGVCLGGANIRSWSQDDEKHCRSVPDMHANRGEKALNQPILPVVDATVQGISTVAQSQRRRGKWDWGRETVSTPAGTSEDRGTNVQKNVTGNAGHVQQNADKGLRERRSAGTRPLAASAGQAELPVGETGFTAAVGQPDPAGIRAMLDVAPPLSSGGLFGSLAPHASSQGSCVTVVSPPFAPAYCHGATSLDCSAGGLQGHSWPVSPICTELGLNEGLPHEDASLLAAAARHVVQDFAIYPQRKEQETFGPGPLPPVIFVSASVPELLPSQVQFHPAGPSMLLCSPFPITGPVAEPAGPYFFLPSAGHSCRLDGGQEATLGFGQGVPASGILMPSELRGPWPVWGQGGLRHVGHVHSWAHEVQVQDCVPVGLAERAPEGNVNKPADRTPRSPRIAVVESVVDGPIVEESCDTGCSEAIDETSEKLRRQPQDEPEGSAEQDEPFRLPPVSRMNSAPPTFPTLSREKEKDAQIPRSEERQASSDYSGCESEGANSRLDWCTGPGNTGRMGRPSRCRSVDQSRCGLQTFFDGPSNNSLQEIACSTLEQVKLHTPAPELRQG